MLCVSTDMGGHELPNFFSRLCFNRKSEIITIDAGADNFVSVYLSPLESDLEGIAVQ